MPTGSGAITVPWRCLGGLGAELNIILFASSAVRLSRALLRVLGGLCGEAFPGGRKEGGERKQAASAARAHRSRRPAARRPRLSAYRPGFGVRKGYVPRNDAEDGIRATGSCACG